MKKCIGVLFVLATIIVPGMVAKTLAQMGPPNGIAFTDVVPSTGQVQVSGTYTVASGYTFSSVTVDVMPTGGAAGVGGEAVASVDGNGNFNATISVPSGTNDLQAMLTVTDNNGTPYYFFSYMPTGAPVP